MKISYNWLKDLVPDLHRPPHEVAQLLTNHSFETVVSQRVADDVVLEADVTPNRAHDCLSMVGIAREVAALLRLSVKEPELARLPEPKSQVAGFSLQIADAKLTPRYMNVLFKGLGQGATPYEMQARLLVMGARPISPVVDITNYVMFEIGNPTHAFAADKLPGKKMGVRPAYAKATAGESLALLDDRVIAVPNGALVITSNDKPVALAGVMGGAGTEVDEGTKDVLLEVANFHPYTIQKAAAALGLRTEAAARFLKGLEPERAGQAAARVAQLLQEICGAEVEGVLDFYPNPPKPTVIAFDPARVSQVAGVPVEPQKAEEILERLRCEIDGKKVVPPADRLDLTGDHDLVEEVVRVVGLENIPANEAAAVGTPQPLPFEIFMREQIRDSLVAQGFTETYNYSFAAEGPLEIINPVSPEQKFLRASLLPGLIANFVKNKAEFHQPLAKANPALFEIGQVFTSEGEKQHLAVMMEGDKEAMRKIWQKLVEDIGIKGNSGVNIRPVTTRYPQPLVAGEINLDALLAVRPGQEAPVKTLEQIRAEASALTQFKEWPKYPAVYRDLSVLVPASTRVETVQEIIERVGGELVVDVDLFDEYQQSLAFHIQYQSPDRTLTDTEISLIHKKIEEALKQELGAQVR